MEILGIGPGEFILILFVLLVVVGPERLPGLARQAGRFLVRARNWMQTSPDAALILRARQEIEAELAEIKSSLMEVQVVRDEVIGAARQLEDSVKPLTSAKLDLKSMLSAPAEPTVARTTAAASSASEVLVQPATASAATELVSSAGETLLSLPANGAAHAPAPELLASLDVRLQAIMSDLWALQEQLKQHGALDQAWQPPSWSMQLPDPAHPNPEEPPVHDAQAPEEEQIPAPVSAEMTGNHVDSTPSESVATSASVSTYAPTPAEDPAAAAALDAASQPEILHANTEASGAGELTPTVRPRKRRAPASPRDDSTTVADISPKPRKRRAASAQAAEANEVPLMGEPLLLDAHTTATAAATSSKPRKRRVAAAVEPEAEPDAVTTEEAS